MTAPVKPGIKTTEFYVSAIAAILAQIVALGWLPAAANAYVTTNIQGIAQFVVALIILGYNLSRAIAKHGTTPTVVDTSALQAAELKLNMPPEWVSAMPRLVAFLDMVASTKAASEPAPATTAWPEPDAAPAPVEATPEPVADPPPAEHAAPDPEPVPDTADPANADLEPDPDEDVPPL